MKTQKQGAKSVWSLAGAAVVVDRNAVEVVRTAGGELARYLYLLTGWVSPVVPRLPSKGTCVVLDRTLAAGFGVKADPAALGTQGYRLATVGAGARRCLFITAAEPVGILYGVYGLLERLGMGFYAGGDTFPERPAPAAIPAGLDAVERPAFTVRGNMLHYNFLCGTTDWGAADYKFYFDQLARMRGNMLLMHWYDDEPGAAYQWRGEYRTGGVTPNSLTKPWGAVASLRTSEFSFGAGRFFDEEIYSSPAGEDLPDLLTEIKRTEALFRDATRYARGAGIEVAAGFEAPREDPACREVEARFKARVTQFLERNPYITRFALWEHEGGGCVGTPPPPAGSPGAALLAGRRADFAYLGNEQRVWEAIRFGRFAEIAFDVLARQAPRVKLVLVGWGGDRWMQFADYCLGYDKLLPAGVAFTCHDNIDASMGPNVSTPWGQLPPGRERWAMPWVEGDIDECAVRQPNVESLGLLAPDALSKGCQGLLTLQWRTRDVEEETGYITQFAWDTKLTPDRFYRRLARCAFGPDQEKRMGRHLAVLQRLGSRWTGVRGTAECSQMRWCGWVPHYPFEVDGKAAAFLATKAEAAAKALAQVPVSADAEAAFHLLPQDAQEAAVREDRARLGVSDLEQAAARLHALETETDEDRLRKELADIEESVYAIRPKLVAHGMTSRSYQAIDGFLIPLHHLKRNAGAKRHMAAVRVIRRDLDRLAALYGRQKRVARLERLDYLAATMDMVLAYDRAAMLLADGEPAEQALAEAAREKEGGNASGAATVAARAYRDIVAAGMNRAVAALARKLTTRCDFGTLATFSVKQMPYYWRTIGRLEEFLPAVPPREVQVRGGAKEVWISWTPGPRTAGQNLYRRRAGKGTWKRVSRATLAGGCKMFVDCPPAAGEYEYAVSALDQDGWESPCSHVARTAYGRMKDGPRVVACKPFTRLAANDDLAVRVVALSDRDIRSVVLRWRVAGQRAWQAIPMTHRFRQSYTGGVSAGLMSGGTVEFFVEATDGDGRQSVWPASAPALPWSVSIATAK